MLIWICLSSGFFLVACGLGYLLFRSRATFAALSARLPPGLLDLDTEVQRLASVKSATEGEIREMKVRAERQRAAVEQEIATRKQDWERQFSAAVLELERLHREVEGLSEEAEIQSFGLYKPRYSFATAEGYKQRLDGIRERQKAMLKDKLAAACSTKWEVEGSTVRGRQMTDRQIKLMLRAFNGECEAVVSNVSWKNVEALRTRIEKSFDAVNKLGETMQCQIASAFLALRYEELDLAYEYQEKVHEEKEELRQEREQAREEEKANREIERERDEAEREEERFQRAMEKARAELGTVSDSQRAAVDAKLAKLEKMLAQASERKQRAISQAELTKLGHVYILSNEGTFGPNVFKIGMTRRLEPLDRVDELGSASVPFRFDVHALIRSDDAPALEQKLHDALEPHRVNLVNHRKEYFRVPLEKVIDLVNQHHGKVEFAQSPEAVDYRKTLAIRAEREAMVAGKAAQAVAVGRVDQLKARHEELRKAMI